MFDETDTRDLEVKHSYFGSPDPLYLKDDHPDCSDKDHVPVNKTGMVQTEEGWWEFKKFPGMIPLTFTLRAAMEMQSAKAPVRRTRVAWPLEPRGGKHYALLQTEVPIGK